MPTLSLGAPLCLAILAVFLFRQLLILICRLVRFLFLSLSLSLSSLLETLSSFCLACVARDRPGYSPTHARDDDDDDADRSPLQRVHCERSLLFRTFHGINVFVEDEKKKKKGKRRKTQTIKIPHRSSCLISRFLIMIPTSLIYRLHLFARTASRETSFFVRSVRKDRCSIEGLLIAHDFAGLAIYATDIGTLRLHSPADPDSASVIFSTRSDFFYLCCFEHRQLRLDGNVSLIFSSSIMEPKFDRSHGFLSVTPFEFAIFTNRHLSRWR